MNLSSLLPSIVATLNSVVGPRHVDAWNEGRTQVEDSPLAQFHAKYWGVSMEEEVNKWQKSVQDMDMDIDVEGDNNNGDGDGGEVCDEQKGEDEGEGEGEDEGEDEKKEGEDSEENEVGIDDYIEGCYVLDINIVGIESSIWVRAEYIRILDRIVKLHNNLTSSNRIEKMSYCVIITGQPGIGKSKFFEFLKRICCAEKRPFVLYQEGHRYLVVQEGVFKSPSDFLSSQYQGFVWTLVDADEDTCGVPRELVTRHTRHFVIYSSSPTRSRWARVHKTVKECVIVMNPWTRREIHLAAPLRLDKPDFDHVNSVFDELGPIPRLCLDYTEDELSKYMSSLSKALSDLTIKKLEYLVGAAMRLEMDTAMDNICHKIFLIQRLNPTNVNFEVEVLPITAIVGSRITFQLRNADRREQIHLYKQLTALPAARKLSGNVFEAYCQQRFSDRISIEFVPMVRLEDLKAPKNKRRYLHRWYTTNTELAPPSLETARKAALKKRTSLDIRPSSTVEFIPQEIGGKKLRIKPNVYYSPAAPNQEGFGSFIVHDGTLYLFQFTNATAHVIKDFFDLFAKCSEYPAQKNWRFIFVIPSDTETALTCPVPTTDDLRKLALYSAEVAVAI